MKTLITSFLILFSFSSLSFASEKCLTCEKAQSIELEVQETYALYLKIQEDHKKNNVENPVTQERIDFEKSLGEAYRFVCDFENSESTNFTAKTSLYSLVKSIHSIGVDNEAISDLYGCFYKYSTKHKEVFSKISKDNKKLFQEIMKKGQPHYQDRK